MKGSVRNSRSLELLTALAALLAAPAVHAEGRPAHNAYFAVKPAAPFADPRAKAQIEAALGFVAARDPQRGAPTFFWASPQGVRAPATPAPAAWARFYLDRHAALYGLSRAALRTAVVTGVHDTGRGGIVVTLRQRVGGVDVLRSDVKVLMKRDGELVAISGNLHPSATPGIKRGAGFTLTAAAAVASAFEDLYEIRIGEQALVDAKKTRAGYRYFDLAATPETTAANIELTRPARVKKVFFPMPDRLLAGYYVELMAGVATAASSDAYAYVIAADDGRVLHRKNLTQSAAFTYRVSADGTPAHRPTDGPQADFAPHPTGVPDGSSPAFVLPILVTMDGFNKNSNNTFDPWLPAGATQTLGNNVDAYTDHKNPDGFSAGDLRAAVTSAGVFDRTYDTALGPLANSTQEMAAVTQLFYVNNWLHDWYYDSGFDEAAGNAQANNFGRGGVGGDVLLAEGQDGASPPDNSRNNANMTTPADGSSPRMQMFVWTGADARTLTVQPQNQALATGAADFGPQSFNVTAQLGLAVDGTVPVNDGCEAITTNLANRIALIDRGLCTFVDKAQAAQAAGAVGVIIADNVPCEAAPAMGGTAMNIQIPVLSVSQADGALLKSALMGPSVTVTMSRALGVERDGTIDNGIIAHEWGHYLHHRLVECAAPQCDGQSEGWGDFNALHMVVRPGDNLGGTYATGIYASATFGDSGYFGIRRYPYTADMNKNGLTFKHIQSGVALPACIPAASADPDNAEPHNVGEVWASMMFESYLALLGDTLGASPRYTFDEARRVMSDDVVAGMKLAPVDPTFTEQRDGVLAAARAGEPLDFALFAQAFAKRGAGACAVSPPRDSVDLAGVVESFDTKPDLAIVSVALDDSIRSCDGDGVLDADEVGKVTITLRNTGWTPLTGAQATVTSGTPSVTFPSGATAVFGTIDPLSTGTATVDVALAASVAQKLDGALDVVVSAAGACVTSTTDAHARLLNYDNVPTSSATDAFESDIVTWTPLDASGPSDVWRRIVPSATSSNHTWYAPDLSGIHDERLQSPPIVVGNGNLTLTFQHRYQFETDPQTNWDGGLIEVSADGGQTWQDISTYGNPGYGGKIGGQGAGNPLLNRQGYVGQNAAWPAMTTTTVNMGATLAGQTIRIRFRLGTDEAAGAFGWEIDNVAVQGAASPPFSSVVDDGATCPVNNPPIANAGPDQVVPSGAFVTLDASASSDPDNDPIAFSWSQVGGPLASLGAPTMAITTFFAPVVAVDTSLTFQVAVSDAQSAALDSVNVLVLQATSSSSSSSSSSSGAGGAGGSTTSTGGAGGTGTGGGGSTSSGTGGMATGGMATGGTATGGTGGETTSTSTSTSANSGGAGIGGAGPGGASTASASGGLGGGGASSDDRVYEATGSGICSCNVVGNPGGGSSLAPFAVAVAALWRRRRSRARAAR